MKIHFEHYFNCLTNFILFKLKKDLVLFNLNELNLS